jgi:chloramphenicol 3-O-phosphotransferase
MKERTILADCLLTKACEVNMVTVSIDVKKLNARAKMVHQLPQRP